MPTTVSDESYIVDQFARLQTQMQTLCRKVEDRPSSHDHSYTNRTRSRSTTPDRRVTFADRPRTPSMGDGYAAWQPGSTDDYPVHRAVQSLEPPIQRSRPQDRRQPPPADRYVPGPPGRSGAAGPQWRNQPNVNIHQQSCTRCGSFRCMGQDRCFANNKRCFTCGEFGHLSVKCVSGMRNTWSPRNSNYQPPPQNQF